MAAMSTLFGKGCCQACGEQQSSRWREYCSRECRMMRAEFEGFCTLQFIATNARWAGGNGLESLDELMTLAVLELPLDEEPLWRLLIEIYESQNLPVGYSAW